MMPLRCFSTVRLFAAAALFLGCGVLLCQTQEAENTLPDAPSYTLEQQNPNSVTVSAPPPLSPKEVEARTKKKVKCNPYAVDCAPTNRQPILNGRSPEPILSPKDKLILAGRNFSDPFNLAIIGITSGAGVAIDSHSAYGPGFKGWGKSFGVGLSGSATGEFFGTFAVPSLTHQDPRYHRMPEWSIKKRLWHAISRTVVAQSDRGNPMPNYGTLAAYPITNEIANLYVPGIQTDARSTGKRIALGYATDPINNLISEFLPDVAVRIHVRAVFFQQILNKIATDQSVAQ